MPELAVQWLEKKFRKYEKQFYNAKNKCCMNARVKDFVLKRDIYKENTTKNQSNASTDSGASNDSDEEKQKNNKESTNSARTPPESSDAAQLVEGMSLIHVYFKELEVLKYSKQENYAAIDLIGMIFLHIMCACYG